MRRGPRTGRRTSGPSPDTAGPGAPAKRRPDLTRLAPELAGLTRRTALIGAAATACTVAQGVLLAHAIVLGVTGVPETGPAARTLGALAVVIALRVALSAWAEVHGRRTGLRAVAALRARLVDVTLASASAGDVRPGALAATAVHGADAVATYAGRYVPQRVVGGVGPLLALAVVAVVDPLSAGLLAFALPIAIGFLILVGLRAQAATDARHAGLALLDGHLLDVLRGAPVLRAFGRERAQVEQVRIAGEHHREGTMAVLRQAFLSSFVLEFVAMLGTALVAVACGIRLAGGHMDFAAAITALVLAPEVFAPVRRLGAEYHAAADAEPVLRALVDGLERDGVVPGGLAGVGSSGDAGGADGAGGAGGVGRADGAGRTGGVGRTALAVGPDAASRARTAVVPDAAVDDVVLQGVVAAAPGRERPALDAVDLRISAGRTTALVGASGSGKTTVLRLLAALRAPAAGAVRCGDTDLAATDLDAWRARVAWIPQHPALLPATLRENVLLGTPGRDGEVRAALTAVGLAPLAGALPAGLDTPLGDGGLPLSAGERRRLAMARALVRDPALVLVDEPTANLDAATAEEVVRALEVLVHGRTAVLATHDPAPLRLADAVVTLSGGRLVPTAAGRGPSGPAPGPGSDVPTTVVPEIARTA